ncbi:nucleotidyltransferase domain-containing protein [Mammaliicoccus sciuri]|nr:nucleotidyltransferase domain-containing protein [Mammaliicoccus sciuri]
MVEKYKIMIDHYINKKDEILAAFYGGSLARNDSDIYSDIDLRIVINDDAKREKFICEFIDLFENILFI